MNFQILQKINKEVMKSSQHIRIFYHEWKYDGQCLSAFSFSIRLLKQRVVLNFKSFNWSNGSSQPKQSALVIIIIII